MVDLFRYQKWDLVSKRGIYYVISGLMLLAGMIFLFAPGHGLNKGIDFTGGGLVSYAMANTQHIPQDKDSNAIADIRAALDAVKIQNEVQISPGIGDKGDQIIVRTMLGEGDSQQKIDELNNEIGKTITPAVNKVVKDYAPTASAPSLESQDVVSGTIKDELINKGIAAMVLGSILIILWIWVRYNIGGLGLRYSAAGIIALFHDLGTLVGMFALLHFLIPDPNLFQVNSPFIAALLTVLGYSIHDTIVIFDRIRENIRLRKGRTFAETVNISLLETMARSVNTVLTVLFTLLALLFFGGPTLRDFVAAMLIGVTVGGYSSIFIASQLLVTWSKGKDREILPLGDLAPVTASAGPVPAPRPVVATAAGVTMNSGIIPSSAPTTTVTPTAPASRDAVQRARQAGKTSKRKR